MTIRDKLNTVISSMSDFSRQTNMVAINAAIHAGKLTGREAAPFMVLSREIQNMSARSMDKLEELDRLVGDIGEVSRLINQTGRQRMLLMKMVNASLMNDTTQVAVAVSAFSDSMVQIQRASINSVRCEQVIHSIRELWDELQSDMSGMAPEEMNGRVLHMIDLINDLLREYEKFAGQ
ncbi:hypothetical protein BFP72_16430 [Reichenbachiella sp. 5M10]|uniref:methyl-accepting chemotaxis protein n=1 Tax=Reichenbachiella sp. 5M10 TaxID=1889772 RepID=UPI000C1489D9|nr:methyl-accepting chemotaxis protein [Reichenbachiella sp. 5M10]PIB36874.1 hypothetical protein BFP72_16430 [Reichenbachiella sp. 5M10]